MNGWIKYDQHRPRWGEQRGSLALPRLSKQTACGFVDGGITGIVTVLDDILTNTVACLGLILSDLQASFTVDSSGEIQTTLSPDFRQGWNTTKRSV